MAEPLRVTSRPRWVGLTVFVLILVVLFVLLGQWQLGRARTQHGRDQEAAAARAVPAADVAEVLTTGGDPSAATAWRAVTATGVYDADHQMLVRNRPLDSANGYLVVVPLRTPTGDLLVARGWIPSGETAAAPDTVPAVPTGTITVAGRVRLPEPPDGKRDLPAGQVERIVPSEVAALTGRPTYAGWVALGTEQPSATPDQTLRTLPEDGSSGWRWPISHTVYAVQWFIFAAIAIGGWVLLVRRDVLAGRSSERSLNG